MHTVIAERNLICVSVTGDQKRVAIRLGLPYKDQGGSWACQVTIDDLWPDLRPIHGEDSFQSLMLARKFAYQLLSDEVTRGSKFIDAEEGYEIQLEALFNGGL